MDFNDTVVCVYSRPRCNSPLRGTWALQIRTINPFPLTFSLGGHLPLDAGWPLSFTHSTSSVTVTLLLLGSRCTQCSSLTSSPDSSHYQRSRHTKRKRKQATDLCVCGGGGGGYPPHSTHSSLHFFASPTTRALLHSRRWTIRA